MRKFSILVALALALSACGSGHGPEHGTAPTTSASPGAVFNQTDVSFASGMIPHHAQAVTMADLAPTRSTDPKVLSLAKAIEAAQQPEIDTMTGWLKSWGQPLPDTNADHTGHASMPGMMSADEMKKLTAAKGTDFDKMFLDMMIRHHEGALTMARQEQSAGANAAAKALAGQIIAGQEAEIAQMRAMLAG